MADPALGLQSGSGSTSTGAAIPVVLGVTKAGGTLVSAVWCKSVATCPSVADNSGSNTWTPLTSFTDPSNGRFVRLFYSKNILGGAVTVTSALNGSTDSITHSVVELPPIVGVRVENHASGAGTMPSVSLAGTQINDICVMLENANGGSFVQVADLCGTNADFAKSSVFGDVSTFDGYSSGGTISISSKTTGAGAAPTNWSAVAVAFQRAIHVAQTQSNQTTATATGTSLNRTYAAAVIQGSCLSCQVQCTDVGGETFSVSDSVNGSWGAAVQSVDDGTKTTALFLFPNTNVGTPVVTVTYGITALNRGLWIQEVRNASPSPLDGTNGQTQPAPGNGTDAITSLTATNAVQPALILGLSFDDRTVSPVAPAVGTGFIDNGAGWTFAGGNQARLESKRITTTTAVAATFTGTTGVVPTTLMVLLDEIADVGAVIPLRPISAYVPPSVDLPPVPQLSAGFGQAAQPPRIFASTAREPVATAAPQLFAGFGQAAQPPAITQARVAPTADYLPVRGPSLYAGALAAAAAGVVAQISAPTVPAPPVPTPALYAGSANDPGVITAGVVGAFLPDEAPPPVGPVLFAGVPLGAAPAVATIAFARPAPAAPAVRHPVIAAGSGQAAQPPVIIGSTPAPQAELPPVEQLFSGFGASAQVASILSVSHSRPPVAAVAPALFTGAGQAAQPPVILGSPVAPFVGLPPSTMLAAGFGQPAQVATLTVVASAPAPVLATTPAWFAGVIPPATTSGVVARATIVQLQELPPRGTLAAGFGQAAQPAAVISAPLLPAHAERLLVPSWSAGAGQPALLPVPLIFTAPQFAPWVELPPAIAVRAGAGQAAQVAAVYSPQVLPGAVAIPPAGALVAGVVPAVAPMAAVYQVTPPAAAALPPQPSLSRGFGQAAQPPVIVFSVQHAPRGDLPPMGAILVGVQLQPTAFVLRSPAVHGAALPPANSLARGFGLPSQVATIITVPFVTTGITLLPPGTALFAGFGQAAPTYDGPAAPPWCSPLIDLRSSQYWSRVIDLRIK